MFAPRFAIHDPVTNSFVHHEVLDSDPERRSAALAAAYSNDTLITRFDDNGVPSSSSTEPSLMATMLEALDVEPGHRVLEIGTGTGYNAALLCQALDQENVTTIDVDPTLVSTARTALAMAGYEPTIRCGDGAADVPDRAPFDRIIATCGVDRVPTAWLDQLAPGGSILVNVSKGIVLLQRQGHCLVGRFLGSAGFMPLRSEGSANRWDSRRIMAVTSGIADRMNPAARPPDIDFTMAAFFACLIADRSQLVFVYDDDRNLSSYRWIHPGSASWARIDVKVDHAIVGHTGPRRLWAELAPVVESWQAAGRPGIDRYGLTVTREGQHAVWLDQPHRMVALL